MDTAFLQSFAAIELKTAPTVRMKAQTDAVRSPFNFFRRSFVSQRYSPRALNIFQAYPGCIDQKCDNGACYGAGERCDGKLDCRDGTDEFNCSAFCT